MLYPWLRIGLPAQQGLRALAGLPVVMGEAAKKDGLATEPATVHTSLAVFNDVYQRLSTSPDASRDNTGNPEQPVVTLDDCERAYKQFVKAYGDKSWCVLGNDALKALREINEFEWTPQVTRVNLFPRGGTHVYP